MYDIIIGIFIIICLSIANTYMNNYIPDIFELIRGIIYRYYFFLLLVYLPNL